MIIIPLSIMQHSSYLHLNVNEYKYVLYYCKNLSDVGFYSINKRLFRHKEIKSIGDNLISIIELIDMFNEHKNKRSIYGKIKDETYNWLMTGKHTLMDFRLTLFIQMRYYHCNKQESHKSYKPRIFSYKLNKLLKILYPYEKNSRQHKTELLKTLEKLLKIPYTDGSIFIKKI
jgi:hypothetical protein